MKKQAGFTLMEILIVVIIVGILASVALPQYFKSLERSRSSQVLLLLSHIAQAQERKYFQINKFVTNFRSLDVTFPGASETIFYTLLQEPEGTLQLGRFYYTLDLYPVSQMWLASNPGEGDEPPGTPIPGLLHNGFMITLAGVSWQEGAGTARRDDTRNPLQYEYTFKRHYASNETSCTGQNARGAELCADMCGIEELNVDEACCTSGQRGACPLPSNVF